MRKSKGLGVVATGNAPQAIGPYSQAITTNGLIFTAGQIALDPQRMELVGKTTAEQTEQVLKNILAVLKEAKMGPENVVKASVFLADLADFPQMNEVYGKFLGKEPPARSTIQAAGLPKGARIEIDVIAAF